MRKVERKTKAKKRRPYKDGDYQKLAEEIIRPAKDKRAARDAAKAAHRHRARRTTAHRSHADTPTLRHGSPKMLDKAIRKVLRMPTPPKNPYAALMAPMVIVPDNPNDKVLIADAGSIIRLMDQTTLYRDRVSPITRRADELLVQYGKADKPKLGWLTNKQPSTVMKPTKGPTFLVTTRSEDGLVAWEQLRLKVARTRKSDPTNWIAPWLAMHGAKVPQLLREVTRYFGGKPIKNEGFDARCTRLFSLILNTELDMATAKKSKASKTSKKVKVTEAEAPTRKTKKGKTAKTKSAKKKKKTRTVADDRITKEHDEFVIKRLVKENPRRAGSQKAKIWDKLKKGMTVGQFVETGGTRGAVRKYVENGWVKLLARS